MTVLSFLSSGFNIPVTAGTPSFEAQSLTMARNVNAHYIVSGTINLTAWPTTEVATGVLLQSSQLGHIYMAAQSVHAPSKTIHVGSYFLSHD